MIRRDAHWCRFVDVNFDVSDLGRDVGCDAFHTGDRNTLLYVARVVQEPAVFLQIRHLVARVSNADTDNRAAFLFS